MKLTDLAVQELARREAERAARAAEVAKQQAEKTARETRFAAAFVDWLERTYGISEFDDPAAEVVAAETYNGRFTVKLKLTDGDVAPDGDLYYVAAGITGADTTPIRRWVARYWEGMTAYVSDFATFPAALLYVYEHVGCGPFAEPDDGAQDTQDAQDGGEG